MRRVLLVASLLLWCACAVAENMTLVVAADPYPPYTDPKSSSGGLSIEIVRAAYKTQGFDVKLDVVPWARAEMGAKEGRYDLLLNVWRTEARTKDFLFSTPFAISKIKFIKLKGDTFEYTGLESLKGKRIGTIRGYGYSDAFNASLLFIREDVSELSTNLKKLVLKRIDLTLEDELTARSVLVDGEPDLIQRVEFTANSLLDNPLYVASGLKNKNHQAIIDAFNKGFEIIKTNGTLAKIHKAYGLGK
jgi:polar amino acid transport system substrate-binding protein